MPIVLQAVDKPRRAILLQPNARIIAGGTLIVADLNYGRLGVETLVTLDQLGLDTIKIAGSKVSIGAVVTIAALLPRKHRRIAGVRIAYGAMAETAIRAPAVEAALEGTALDETAIAAAVAVAAKGTAPQDDAYASAWYRREVLPVHLH